jgi:predicted transcriptional regulator
MTAVAISKLLGISQSAVTRAAYRGEEIASANNLALVEKKTQKNRGGAILIVKSLDKVTA